ncbi:MAG: hypothetical protein ACREJ3_16735 [Polyangiaceae bacterium]
MIRDSLFCERIVWQGPCRAVAVPFTQKVMGVVAAVVSAVTLCYAVVLAESIAVPVGGMILLAGWCMTIALGAWRLPIWWRSQIEYVVTEHHVIWRRGRLRRSIEIGQISYALVRWSANEPSTGDLELVRAVPTGALRRTLSLSLNDVDAPDRLWALIRGVEAGAPLGSGERPLGQRLDVGERVLWSAAPRSSPWTPRRAGMAVACAVLALTFVRSSARSVPTLAQLVRAHALAPALAALLVGAAALGMGLLLAVTAGAGYAALVRPARLARATRYFVTNARVLIRRGHEELALDRSRIAYVIDAPSRKLHDVFLVLDGPQARAFAPSGAFGGENRDDALRPVFASIDDADTVGRILRAA